MQKQFYCNDEDDCMPTAINIYFQKKIFNSTKEFNERQYRIVRDIANISSFELSIHMCDRIRVDNHVYKLEYLYSAHRKDYWPAKIQTRSRRALIAYGINEFEGHMECIRFEEDEMILERTGKIARARTQADISLEDFRLLSKNPEMGYWFKLMNYKRIN